MSVTTAYQTLPTFSATYLTSTTISDQLIEPNSCGNAVCPALLEFMGNGDMKEEDDPFRAVTTSRIVSLDPGPDGQAVNNDDKNNLLTINPIHHVNKNLQLAREARLTGDFASAISSYRHVAQILERPASEKSQMPIYSVVPDGMKVLSEAIFGMTALSKERIFGIDSVEGAAPAAQNIERLGHHIQELEALTKDVKGEGILGATKLDLARAKLLQAFNLIQHASSAEVQHDSLYEQAEKIVGEAIYPEMDGDDVTRPSLVDPANGMEDAEIHFLGGLIIVESLARRMDLAHKAKNHDGLVQFADRILFNLRRIYDSHFKKNEETGRMASAVGEDYFLVDLFAKYEGEVAILKYSLGLGYHALNRVRSIVEGSLDHTAAAQMLRDHEFFKDFFDHGRFLHFDEIAERASFGAFMRRVQAAFAYAHSPSLKHTVITGGVGMLGGVFGAALAGHPEYGWAAGGLGASAVEGAFRLFNGYNTRQARNAAKIGTNRITGEQTAVDVMRFAANRLLASMVWAAPSAALAVAPEFMSTIGDTVGNIPGGYATAFSRIADCPEVLFPNPFDGNIGHTAYQLYTKGALALFLTNLVWKKSRKYTKDLAFAFIPGALMLSADLGLALAPPDALTDPFDAWFNRIGIASIVGSEMLFMMLTTGLTPLAKTGSLAESFKSLGNTLLPIKGNADYNLPLAAMIVTGLSSPLGGIFQQGLMRPEDIPLIVAQGAAITTGLLGLTLGMSGILKRQIPIGASTVRAVKDVIVARENEKARLELGEIEAMETPLWRYPYEAVRGVGAAFNVGYVRNRVLRIPGPDMVASAGRLILGGGSWDNQMGQAAMSTINGISGNPYWDSTYPAASGTQPEEMSFINAVDKALTAKEAGDAQALEILNDFFRKAGQVIHPMHFFLPHNSAADRLWPLYSFTKTIKPPTFPQRPNPFLFASVFQVLADHIRKGKSEAELRGDPDNLSAEQFELLLDYVKQYSTDTKVYHVMRPLVKTLLLARNSARFGKRIESFFFKENPHLFTLLSIDPDRAELQAFEERFSRISRGRVRGIVRQSQDTYEDRIRRYHKKNGNGNVSDDLDGLFQTLIDPAWLAVKNGGGGDGDPADEAEMAVTEIAEQEDEGTHPRIIRP